MWYIVSYIPELLPTFIVSMFVYFEKMHSTLVMVKLLVDFYEASYFEVQYALEGPVFFQSIKWAWNDAVVFIRGNTVSKTI